MHIANISDAKAHLSQLVQRALAGDEVIIARADRPLVRLMPVALDMTPRRGGQWAGQVEFLGDDFEFSELDIDELFYGALAEEDE
ncbi:MAG: type II toxin-antitoxin system prevent-host-death family antitoxin [Planctomycetales bacterium]|nr:type II toxin-antitoxin system prevent-host-death family antitoxin [Planctomycetales bacterium]